MIYEKLKSIEDLVENKNYCYDQVSYYIGIEKLNASMPITRSIQKMFTEHRKNKFNENEIKLIRINEPVGDIKKICSSWHFEDDVCGKLLEVIDNETEVYQFCDNDKYNLYGNIVEEFRIVKKNSEAVLMDFNIED